MSNKSSFHERAARFGVSAEHLKAGQAVTVEIPVADVEALRALVGGGETHAQRAEIAQELFGSIPLTDPERDASEEGILRRVNQYLYGNLDLSQVDRVRVAHLFPMTVKAYVAQDMPVNGKKDLTGIPFVTVGTVTMADQSYIITYASALAFTCDNIVRNGSAPQGYGDFNIFGATGTTGQTGTQPGAGSGGQGGSKGTCKSPGVAGDAGGKGTTGGAGSTGGAGGPGGTAGASQATTIIITNGFSVAKTLSILTRSGTGGAGGLGATGAQGGTGGVGGNGANCGCEGTNGGAGAPGGVGGTGGTGGNGTSGANYAGNIIVRVPAIQKSAVLTSSLPCPAGAGGAPGGGGVGGAGGGGGSNGKHQDSGNGGGTGGQGTSGGWGQGGASQGQPAEISVQPI